MRILAVVHERNASLGVFEGPARAGGHELVEWIPSEAPPPALDGLDAAIVLGSEAQVDAEDAYPWLRPEKELLGELLGRGRPVLGVCFGSQLLAEAAGGAVRRASEPEIGWHEIVLTGEGTEDPLLGFLPERFEGFGWHYYEWLLPPGAVALARSPRYLQAFRLEGRQVWGVQFHPEVTQADLGSWLDGWEDDPEAVATGLDPEAIRSESARRSDAWNDVGRDLARRFLARADAAPSAAR